MLSQKQDSKRIYFFAMCFFCLAFCVENCYNEEEIEAQERTPMKK